MEKPHTSHVSCKLCHEWKCWKNGDGVVTTIRKHLKGAHSEEYKRVCKLLNLKHSDKPADAMPNESTRNEPFNLKEWLRRLVKWIVVDDQSINIVECPEFREFVIYGHCNISEKDLPHRTKLTELIFAAYEQEHQHLKVCYRKSLGCVSFSSDLWSDPNLVSFMALTSHFLSRDNSGHLHLDNRLLAFRVVDGKHDRNNIAKIVMGRFGSELQSEPGPNRTERQLRGPVRLFVLNRTDSSGSGSANSRT